MEELCFPEFSNVSCSRPSSSPVEVFLLYVSLSFISLLTTVLNLLLIVSVSHFRKLQTPTNLLLLSLAVSDFLVGLLLMPGEILRNTSCWYLGDAACSLYNYFSFTITSASVGDMVLVSVDRYVAVCDPLRYAGRVTERRVKVCVALCWFCSALYSGAMVMPDLPGGRNSCYGECVIIVGQALGSVDLLVTFLVPVSVIVVLYLRVFVVAVLQARAARAQVVTFASDPAVKISVRVSLKSELKAARTLGVLILVFLSCFCPYYCVSLAGDTLLGGSKASYVIFLFYLNSSLNPVIYALFYPWFRKAVKLIATLRFLQTDSAELSVP